LQAAAKRFELRDEQAAVLKAVFEPGEVGFILDAAEVTRNVDERKQAHRLGVRDEMRLLTVAGEPYTPYTTARLFAAKSGNESYELTFVQASETEAQLRKSLGGGGQKSESRSMDCKKVTSSVWPVNRCSFCSQGRWSEWTVTMYACAMKSKRAK